MFGPPFRNSLPRASESELSILPCHSSRRAVLISFRIDEENAAEDDDDFDPSEIRRDYGEIAAGLPVFCVSSKAYQKISGRLQNDDDVAGFAGREDTEIPALQRHASDIVHGTRVASRRHFLNELAQFLTSLYIEVVQSGQTMKLADDLREKEFQLLRESIDKLTQVSVAI